METVETYKIYIFKALPREEAPKLPQRSPVNLVMRLLPRREKQYRVSSGRGVPGRFRLTGSAFPDSGSQPAPGVHGGHLAPYPWKIFCGPRGVAAGHSLRQSSQTD
jgi:hypothetical protein